VKQLMEQDYMFIKVIVDHKQLYNYPSKHEAI